MLPDKCPKSKKQLRLLFKLKMIRQLKKNKKENPNLMTKKLSERLKNKLKIYQEKNLKRKQKKSLRNKTLRLLL